jgi:acyl dehydratase
MQIPKRMFVILLAVLVLGAVTLLTATDNSMAGVGLKQEITFTGPTVIGGTVQIGGKAEATAKCNLVPLNAKAKTTEQRYTENAKNERVLVEMTFRGDTSKHVLEP